MTFSFLKNKKRNEIKIEINIVLIAFLVLKREEVVVSERWEGGVWLWQVRGIGAASDGNERLRLKWMRHQAMELFEVSVVCVCVRVKGFEQIQEDMHCYAWKFLVNWKLDRYGYGGNFHFIIPCLFPTFFYETFFFPTVETENHSFFKLHVLSLIWIFYLLLLLLFFVIYYYSFVYLYLFLINVDKKILLFALSFTKQGVAIIT